MIKKSVTAYIFFMLLCFCHQGGSASVFPMVLQTVSANDYDLDERGAIQTSSESTSPQNNNAQGDEVSPLTQLGSKYHNSIELLQNRFRIDYEVEEITMVFFRNFGSPPVVLVKPDGSKVFQATADGENIFWFDTSTYDMISIKKPDIGPWQAVGDILPDSRVMVISDLALHAEKLPNIIFSGEILKQTAYLTNDGEPIDYNAFRDVVELSVSLSSTNNPNFNNFGADSKIIATFQDDGKGMDEVPLDGVFTGQFNLAVADGEWIPSFKVSTPMYSREQVDPVLMLLPNPISIEVDIDDGTGGYHILKVDAVREYVDISTLLVDGKVRYPNGDIHNFSITDMSNDVRVHEIVNFDFGIYRVKLTVFGNTIDGREFILDVPEYSFLVEEPKPPVVDNSVNIEQDAAPQSANQQLLAQEQDPQTQEMSTSTLVSLIIGINLFLLIIGGGLIWLIVSDKKINWKFWKKFRQPKSGELDSLDEEGGEPEKKAGFFARLFKRKAKQNQSELDADDKPNAQGSKEDGGFIDLSMPKD